MMRTLAQTGNGWMTFKDPSNRLCNQTADPRQRGAPLQPLHRDPRGLLGQRDRRVQPRLDQSGRAPRDGTAIDWERLRATVRTAVTFLDRVIDINFYPSEQAAASNPAMAAGRARRHGVAGCLLRIAAAVRLGGRTRAVHPDRRGGLSDCAGDLGRPGRGARAASRPSPKRERLRASCSRICGASAGADRAVGRAARPDRESRAAQLAADRDRADGHHRVDRWVLRVHRAAGVQPVQAGDAVRRVPADQHGAGRPSSRTRGLWTEQIRSEIKRADGSVQGITELPARGTRDLPYRLGIAPACADRPGRRPRPVSSTSPSR